VLASLPNHIPGKWFLRNC